MSKDFRFLPIVLSVAVAVLLSMPVRALANWVELPSDSEGIAGARDDLSTAISEETPVENEDMATDDVSSAYAEDLEAGAEESPTSDYSTSSDETDQVDSVEDDELTPQADGEVIHLYEGLPDFRRVNTFETLNYEFTLSRGGYISLSLEVHGRVILKTSDGDAISIIACNGEESVHGPWALAAGTYQIYFFATQGSFIEVKYSDSLGNYPEYLNANAVFEKQFVPAVEQSTYGSQPLESCATPISVGRPLTGTVYSEPDFTDIDYYSFTVPLEDEYEVTVRCYEPIRYFLVDNDVEVLKRTGMIAEKGHVPTVTIVSTLDLGTLVPGRTYILCFTNLETYGGSSGPSYGAPTGPYFAWVRQKSLSMYRLYNPNSGEHFYTSSTNERDALKKFGWKYEGIGWLAPVKSETPVYRLYNRFVGDHHYTTSKQERDVLIKKHGWTYEGVGWYSASKEYGVPLYRQYNPYAVTGAHNYTISKEENDILVAKYGWKAEGIAWYGVK